jgi:hypothetical protein
VNPEADQAFRLGRLLLVLAAVEEAQPEGVDIERLGCYAFLAGDPLLLARDETDPDRLALRLAGFDDRALSYASPAQRYVTSLRYLPGDLARLIALGLVAMIVAGRIRYRLTADGQDLAGQFAALYAHNYAVAAGVVVSRLRRFSGTRLRDSMRTWLDPAHVIDHDSHSFPEDNR